MIVTLVKLVVYLSLIKAISNYDKVHAMAFSNDGKLLVCGNHSDSPSISLYDGETGKFLKYLKGPNLLINILAFNATGSRLVARSQDPNANVILYDVEKHNKICVVNGNPHLFMDATFSPNGNELLCTTLGQGNGFILLNAETGNQIAQGDGNFNLFSTEKFSSNGDLIVCRSQDNEYKNIYLYDAHTGNKVAVLTGHSDQVITARFSPNNNLLVSGSEGTVHNLFLWNTKTRKKIAALNGHRDTVVSTAFSSDNSRIVSSSATKIILWDANTGKQVRVLHTSNDANGYSGFPAQFSPNSTFLLICLSTNQNNMILYDAHTGKQIAILQGHETPVFKASFSSDSNRILSSSIGEKGLSILWTLLTNKNNRLLKQLANCSENQKTFIHELCDAKKSNQDVQPLIESEIVKSFSPTIQTWLKNVFNEKQIKR